MFNKPWLHFLLLGFVLYQIQSFLFPEPKPVIGPLSEARIVAIEDRWQLSAGLEFTPEVRARLINQELDNDMMLQKALELEVHLNDRIVQQRLLLNMRFLNLAEEQSDSQLFQQAIDMGLHLDDEVVKRRMIQVVERVLAANNPPAEPTTSEVQAEFEVRKASLRRPPNFSFEHIFFTSERLGEVEQVVAKIKDENLSIDEARQFGSPFIQGRVFSRVTPAQLAQNFGQEFVVSMLSSEVEANRWLGPIPSAFGVHYLWISDYEPDRDAEFSEVADKIRNDLLYVAKADALRAAIAELRIDYDVIGYTNLEGVQ